MIHYRAIEFKETPVQPLAGDFSAAPGAAYGQLPVGPGPETALAVVWIAKADGGPVLWLDADGNGRLTPDERHAVSGKQIELAATLTMQKAPQLRQARRTLVFRRPALGTGLAYAVRGYAAGSLDFGGAKHAAILADGNADGCFNSVGHDRVWKVFVRAHARPSVDPMNPRHQCNICRWFDFARCRGSSYRTPWGTK